MELPKYITAHCQATTVKYNSRDYSVQTDKNNFRYIKVSQDGKRKIIPVKEDVPDIIFNHVFNGGFQNQTNKILDMCVLLRIKQNSENTFNENKSKLGISCTFLEFKKQAANLNKQFKIS